VCNGCNGRFLTSRFAPADFAALAPHLTKVQLKEGAVLLRTGSKISLYFPHGGAISLMLDMPDGKTVATAVLGREAPSACCRRWGLRARQ
jgi:hypothetical protein